MANQLDYSDHKLYFSDTHADEDENLHECLKDTEPLATFKLFFTLNNFKYTCEFDLVVRRRQTSSSARESSIRGLTNRFRMRMRRSFLRTLQAKRPSSMISRPGRL
jgi:hypothetical protein